MKLFVTNRFYYSATALTIGFAASYFFPVLLIPVKLTFFAFMALLAADLLLLFITGGEVSCERELPERFSNGDDNAVVLRITNRYSFGLDVEVLDELPPQFQMRNLAIVLTVARGETRLASYSVRPTTRGEYNFGHANLLVITKIALVNKRFKAAQEQTVKVYPSFLHLRKYELIAFSQQQSIEGQRKLRKIGHSMEFDHIKEYTPGDDPRHLNWQASARRGHLMINHYIDEKSQPIYNVIDKSRPMKMPFEGMTLLDYAINASLAISDIALKKGDRAGLVTFQHKPDTIVPAQKGPKQMYVLMESLYHEKTAFTEHNFGMLYAQITSKITSRSLLLLYTNFESLYSLERQLKYLKLLNRKHLVLVIIFRNTELDGLITKKAGDLREVYHQAIAQNMLNEKFAILQLLRQHGILSLYTTPQSLTADVVNKYLELKSRRAI
ncbi:DUF58 domain-containing protein [uncultured Imperialibacter sp.]|uniref:DUF58 domain-containing protein n=1 Tax=uncultured Imperialibacter sp. TaxID=1672639 RepID=UPI0030DD82F9|tara:strand:- start:164 stop:1483 length:1320 start_codon:yes stop_codon:yes gene_type:complete